MHSRWTNAVPQFLGANMSFLASLVAAPDTLSSKQNLFLLEFKANGKTVFIMYEGYDDPSLYAHAVEQYLPTGYSIRFLRCGNKKKVLDFRAWYQQRWAENPRALFCVDKDHDDLVVTPLSVSTGGTLFVTSGYSVENYVMGTASIHRALVECYGVPDSQTTQTAIYQSWSSARSRFASEMLPIMAWLVAQRRAKNGPNTSNISLKVLFDTSDCENPKRRIHGTALYAELSRICNCPSIKASDVTTEMANMPAQEWPSWLRGKQCAEFLAVFLNQACARIKAAIGGGVSPKLQIHSKNVVFALGPRTVIPTDLQAFLSQHLGALP